jgi:NADPH:quinone reductase
MKAIVLNAFGRGGRFSVAQLRMPELRPGDVRVKVRAVSFNPVDYQVRNGLPQSKNTRSMVLGRDLSGTVQAVHEDVTDFRVGDDVFGYVCHLASSGTYAQYVSVPAELLARKPCSLTHEQAAAVPVAGITASLALKKAQVNGNRSVFIAGGAGGVGTFAIRLARLLGVRQLVTTAGRATSRQYLIEQCGLGDDQIVGYKEAAFIERAVRQNGGLFDVALDLVGGPMLSACCALLAVDGDLSSVTEAPSRDDFETLFQKNASFHSVGANAYSLVDDRLVWRKYREMLEQLSRQFDSGALAAPPINVLGAMTPHVVEHAHALLECGVVQGKLVMACH